MRFSGKRFPLKNKDIFERLEQKPIPSVAKNGLASGKYIWKTHNPRNGLVKSER